VTKPSRTLLASLIGLALLVLGQPGLSQKPMDQAAGVPQKEEPKPGNQGFVTFCTQQQRADAVLDVLLERKKALQARSDWLSAEQRLLQKEIAEWEQERTNLQEKLDRDFACSYDMDRRGCNAPSTPPAPSGHGEAKPQPK